jgi:hypothetical protein
MAIIAAGHDIPIIAVSVVPSQRFLQEGLPYESIEKEQ